MSLAKRATIISLLMARGSAQWIAFTYRERQSERCPDSVPNFKVVFAYVHKINVVFLSKCSLHLERLPVITLYLNKRAGEITVKKTLFFVTVKKQYVFQWVQSICQPFDSSSLSIEETKLKIIFLHLRTSFITFRAWFPYAARVCVSQRAPSMKPIETRDTPALCWYTNLSVIVMPASHQTLIVA